MNCEVSGEFSANTSCTATFNTLPPATFSLTVVRAGTGSGTVTSSPAGINCGSTCSATYNSGTSIVLTATAAAGSTFAGWSGTSCTTGTVSLSANTSCTATFNTQTQPPPNPLASRIGVFRPTTG